MKKTFAAVFAISTMMAMNHNVYAAAESARAACVMNAATGEVVFQKNISERLPMASTTKIMTAYTALKNSDLKEQVLISKNAQSQMGSSMYVAAGDRIYMGDLLYGLMLNSGNDAAVAIAEHISGSTDKFAELMTKTAAEMGAEDTAFVNPNGLPQEGHYTTAEDLALITRNALTEPRFCEIVKSRQKTVRAINNPQKTYDLYNHNKLLGMYEGAIGVKTGYTEAAGRCLVSAAERDGMRFIAVTLNDKDDWNTHKKLLDEAFSSHYPKILAQKGECIKELVRDGKVYTLSPQEDFIVPMKKDGKQEIIADIHMASNLEGAINKGEKVGYMNFSLNGENIGRVSIIADEDIVDKTEHELRDSFYSSWKNIWSLLLI